MRNRFFRPTGLRNRVKPVKKVYARHMRANPTKSERILWRQLRQRRCNGYRFRRQAIILGWIADFYCPAARLVVEVDGASHSGRAVEDAKRDLAMKRAGLSVLRIPADLVAGRTDLALRRIAKRLK
jgi:very-short-patch-repair endonuclease